MSGIITLKDSIRDFLRKYDEIMFPVLRFIASFIVFQSINSMFGYSDLFDRGIVIFLMSVISALVSNAVVILIAGVMILVNAISVSVSVGIVFVVLFILIYCAYIRMFQESAWVLAFAAILCMFHLEFAAPVVVAVIAGAAGAIPVALGVVVYYFALYTREIVDGHMVDDENFQAYSYIIDAIAKNKTMLAIVIVSIVIVLVTYVIYRLPFDYSWYVAIGVGSLLNILVALIVNASVKGDLSMGSVFLGSIVGAVVALVAQVSKGIVDYSKKEKVQFEDDEYYYYVKAFPKVGAKKSEASVREAIEQNIKGTRDREPQVRRSEQGGQQRQPQNRDTQNRDTTNRPR